MGWESEYHNCLDYQPAVKELRAAMDERTNIQKPKFRYAEVLEEWLKKRENK